MSAVSIASVPELLKNVRFSSRGDIRKALRGLHLRLVRVQRRDVPELVHLRRHRVDDPRMAVAHGSSEDAAEQIQVFAPFGVPDADTLAFHEGERLRVHVQQRRQQVLLLRLNDLGARRARARSRNCHGLLGVRDTDSLTSVR